MRVAAHPVHSVNTFRQSPRPGERRFCSAYDEQRFGLHARSFRFRGRRPVPGLLALSGASQYRVGARRSKTLRVLDHDAVGRVLRIDGFHSRTDGVLHFESSPGRCRIRLLPGHDVLPVALVSCRLSGALCGDAHDRHTGGICFRWPDLHAPSRYGRHSGAPRLAVAIRDRGRAGALARASRFETAPRQSQACTLPDEP
jgi:hypothetical protein